MKSRKEHDENIWIPCLEELYYLRHHGFPTPILDWSRSFYVAAYFAFIDSEVDKNVALYKSHIEDGNGNSWALDEPTIFQLGSHLKMHHRHFRQQSEYTFASTSEFNNDENGKRYKNICFVSHQEAAEKSKKLMKKYIIKGSERDKVLRKLNMMNINHYTLFGTEDSLIKALATEEFILQD